MIYAFKRESYNWGDTFYIYDENSKKAFHVKSSVVLWNRKFQVFDMDKNLLIEIKKEPKSVLKKKFHIFIQGQQTASVTKEISVIPKFIFEGIDVQMHGVMRHEYELLQDGYEILSYHTGTLGWGEHSILNIADSTDPLLALALVLTLSFVIPAEDSEKSVNYV